MIPKKIHYCWFGGNPLTDEVKKYIETWRRYCPDYEIIEWNESNFDIQGNQYCREAYEAQKWAFVSDYARLKVLYEHGGIYMDTDVEVCKSLDSLLKYDAVSGYESKNSISTGTMAACRGNEWIGILLQDYDNRHFRRSDGSYDLTTNVKVITKKTKDYYGIKLTDRKTVFGENNILLPFEYLCAKSYQTGEVMDSEKTFTIHHFKGSWLSADDAKYQKIKRKIMKIIEWIPVFYIRNVIASCIAMVFAGNIKGMVNRIREKLNDW